MAGKAAGEQNTDVELNMTPMIDVVFLLLIFFMVVSEMARLDSADLSLPYASRAKEPNEGPADPHRMIIVNIEKRLSTPGVGKILVQGKEYDLDALITLIQAEALRAEFEDPVKRISHLRVRIRADREARTKAIQRVLDACQKNMVYKIEVGATKDPTPDDPDVLHAKDSD